MAFFDAYLFIDWSAANRRHRLRPTADAVWTGEFIPGIHYQREEYHRTRRDAVDHILTRALDHSKHARRLLLGFDFPYGYPQGFSQALGLPNGAMMWSHVWTCLAIRIQDTTGNLNNRFTVASDLNALISPTRQGPFYGCPPTSATTHFGTHSPGFPFTVNTAIVLQRLRLPETRLPGTQETWKLFGTGSVGSQAIVGIPYVHQLRNHPQLNSYSKVWPFETQFTNTPSPPNGPFILHAEIWPGVVSQQTETILLANPQLIRDQAQVRAMCQWASTLDQQGSFGQYFATPKGLTPNQIQICTEHEGWVLGAV